MKVPFKESRALSLGAELELQILEADSYALSSSSIAILEKLPACPNFKSELFQSMIEITSNICHNAFEVGDQLSAATAEVWSVCEKMGLTLASAGLHPCETSVGAKIFPHERYMRLLRDRRWVAGRLLMFGFHVHVGVRNGDQAVHMMNGLSSYLPLILALSASSPFFAGEDTQLASCRTTFFESLPTGGHACPLANWSEFEKMYAGMKQAGAVESPRDLWWDIRPSVDLGTIEVRICDAPATISEAVAIVALIHLLAIKFDQDFVAKRRSPVVPIWLARENKWRAARDGVQARLIVNEEGLTIPLKEVLWRLLDELAPLIRSQGYSAPMQHLKTIALLGSSSDRQRQVFFASGENHSAVVKNLSDELSADLKERALLLGPSTCIG